MKIPFKIKDETIFLTADNDNFCLARERERKRGEETAMELENFKWFADIGAALNKLIIMKARKSDAVTLQELKDDIEAARQEVLEAWGPSIHKCQCKGAEK